MKLINSRILQIHEADNQLKETNILLQEEFVTKSNYILIKQKANIWYRSKFFFCKKKAHSMDTVNNPNKQLSKKQMLITQTNRHQGSKKQILL